ncbi:uncharacterized protein EKO05_0008294 [Ascochyta rabiei]|uniref:Uncharacterized protein n=1 Tax=Didymella rabiei TaxID=5454 RepID=A0A163DEV2_DIDRA|nr:uncharacterized protein EKO05_0008294 [Ascochyta rabiei]KZM23116.1 hypothetical protein ST47_g5748 [Ascochyta rabiei]UPX17971.1 hypothetical protein EKO05_0008294 [Ascochyta rabiei]
MTTTSATHLLRRTTAHQLLPRTTRRTLSIEPQPPPPQPPKQPSRVGAFYKSFSAPILKCFLGALFTYQLAYFGWMKLEAIEEAHDKKTEMSGLHAELASVIAAKRRDAESAMEGVGARVGELGDKAGEATEGLGVAARVKKGGWWPW